MLSHADTPRGFLPRGLVTPRNLAIAFAVGVILAAVVADVIAPSGRSVPSPQAPSFTPRSTGQAWRNGEQADSRPVPNLAALVGDTPGRLVVIFADVGQGDGMIIRLPNGKWVIVDANRGAGGYMAGILERFSCREIAAVVMTHPHADHIGGLPEILRRFSVARVYDAGAPYPSSVYRRVLLDIEEEDADYIIPKPGDLLAWDSSLVVRVVSGGEIMADDVNNASIVLHITFGKTTILLTGDAEKEAENKMIANFPGMIRSQILKVGHHGSRSSSRPAFLKEVKAQWGVIQVGRDNEYGLPKDETLTNLAAAGIRIFRNDLEGTILAVSDGDTWTIGPIGEPIPAPRASVETGSGNQPREMR